MRITFFLNTLHIYKISIAFKVAVVAKKSGEKKKLSKYLNDLTISSSQKVLS